MSDYDSQRDLDDELLSAYLDGELSPEESAAVEARVAADPAAQQLLHQLRAVSQAVQGLPQKAAGHELRDSILHRVEQSKASQNSSTTIPLPGSATDDSNGAPVTSSDSIPAWTVGRTRRGWFWASFAVAAALLIMAWQSRVERGEQLPAVAERNERLAKDIATQQRTSDRPLEIRALDETASDPRSGVALNEGETRDESLTANWHFRDSGIANGPMPAAAPPPGGQGIADGQAAPSVAPQAKSDPPTANFGSEMGLDVEDRASSASLAPSSPEPPAASSGALATTTPRGAVRTRAGLESELVDAPAHEEATKTPEQLARGQLVVVRVLTRRPALESKAFDELLKRHGIALETPPVTDDFSTSADESSNRYAEQSAEGRLRLTDHAAQSIETDENRADVVFVEAPTTAIEACLEELHNDTKNFLGLAVDDASAAGDGTPAFATNAPSDARTSDLYSVRQQAAPKQLPPNEIDWAKYQRGTVPQPKELGERDKGKAYHYYDAKNETDYDASFGGFRGGLDRSGGPARLKQEAEALAGKAGDSNRGRALRLRAWDTSIAQDGGEPASSRVAATDQSARASRKN